MLGQLRFRVQSKPLLSLVVTHVCTLFAVLIWYSRNRGGLRRVVAKEVFKLVLRVASATPKAGATIAKETQKIKDSITKSVMGELADAEKNLVIPDRGWDADKLLAELDSAQERDNKHWTDGQVSGCVYHGQQELLDLLGKATAKFLLSNPLHPEIFPSVRKMEAEIVSMVLSEFNAPTTGCGTITSGGTESILMACRVAKNHGHKTRGIVDPEIIAPITAHAAFEKAADYFGMKIIHVPVDPNTGRADVAAVKRAISPNTVLLVGSAPCYPTGSVDPIEELGAIAVKRKLLLHVDCCLGSLLMPFARKAGYKLPKFDFSIPGVTSISCDTHKYGFASKGSSVVMYRNFDLRHHQYFCSPTWTGGIYASPTIAGSRAGCASVAAWTALMHVGQDGFLAAANKIMSAAQTIEKGVRSIPGVRVVGSRDLSIVAIGALGSLNIYNVNDAMTKRGWTLNSLQNPPSIHICVTVCNADKADKFVSDLKSAVEEIQNTPKDKMKEGSAGIYGMAAALPDKSLVVEMTDTFIDALFTA